MKRLSLIAAAAMLTPVLASASPCTAPAFCNDFTALPGATFGGSGIPNDAVATTYGPLLGTFPFQFPSAILGLSAHGNSPGVVTNNGAGTYFAQGGPGPLWSYDWYWFITPLPLSGYSVRLSYDTDPTAAASFVSSLAAAVSGQTQQGNSVLSFAGFNPYTPGTYTFRLELLNASNVAVATDSIDVVVAAVPEPSTYAMFTAGLLVVASIARRRRK